MQHFRPTLAFKPLIPFPTILHLLPLLLCHRLLLLVVSLYILLHFSLLTPSEFFNGMLGVTEPGPLNCYTLFRLMPLTLFVSRNLTLTYLLFSGSLDSPVCDLIAPIPGLVFSLQIPRKLAAASSFLSGGAYPSLNFLPPIFLRLNPTLIM